MEDRKKNILRAIIDDYIETAEPVGSRTIARRYQLGVSPATIRNEMADLEELGYLQQPYTSAGRIPSDKGYRYYVDALMPQTSLSPRERELLWEQIQLQMSQAAVETLVHRAVRLLADMTSYAAVAMAPSIMDSVIKTVQFAPIDSRSVLLVLISEPGFVQHRIVDDLRSAVDESLLSYGRRVTALLRGMPFGSVPAVIREAIREIIREEELREALLEMITAGEKHDYTEKAYLEGSVNLMDQPEFKDVSKAKAVLTALEEPSRLLEMLSQNEGDTVVIGAENIIDDMHECSLVTATYHVKGRVLGTVGVIGPTRMVYNRAITLVDNVAAAVSEALSKVKI
ncbi:MAG TPA: heat-inducible transcription repressor HrcA [Firmicutes bacterium]|nr:heat-inducible transcription repressor HrcA [Bacillota bacterium]